MLRTISRLLLGLVWLTPVLVRAEVVISEVMYDLPGLDQGREWVEIFNPGPNDVTVSAGGLNSDWRFSDGAQHPLVLAKGSATLPPQSYAVIVDSTLRFLSDWPSFSGTIFDSSVSLNNVLGEVSLLSSKNGQVVGRIAYSSNQGADGDGSSLQVQSDGRWLSARPTPGGVNSSAAFVSGANGGSQRSLAPSAHYGGISTSEGFRTETLPLGLGRERVSAYGSPMEFRVDTNLNSDGYGSFSWNFGDGSQAGGSIVSHTYNYPGNYVVVLNASLKEGTAISRVNVRIVDPQFSIVSADGSQVSLKNNSSYEVSLFGRALVSGEKFFPFLKDTIIGPQESLSFSSNVTGLTSANQSNVYVAVLGDTEHPQFKAKIESEKNRQIEFIKNQLKALQEKLKSAL